MDLDIQLISTNMHMPPPLVYYKDVKNVMKLKVYYYYVMCDVIVLM
jgi:hypothetical protein